MENVASDEVEDLRQSKEYARYMGMIGWKVEKGVFIRNLGPVSIAKIQRTELPKEWDRVLKKNHVFMCKHEPLTGRSAGFKQDSWPLLASRTLRVDLRLSGEDIFGTFKKDCRYILRKFKGEKYKVQVNNFEKFYEIWKKSAKRKNLWIPKEKEYRCLVESFGRKCFCVSIGDEAGTVVLVHDKTAYYYYAGATKEGNEKNLPYLVVWNAMKEAKKRGCKIWDFEGIYDSRWPNKGWVGFTHFKKSFGGKEVEFPGSFTKWCWPF